MFKKADVETPKMCVLILINRAWNDGDYLLLPVLLNTHFVCVKINKFIFDLAANSASKYLI